MMKIAISTLARFSATVSLVAYAAVGMQAQASAAPDAQARQAWRESLSHTPAPSADCFRATYPSTVWTKTKCVEAPKIEYRPRSGFGGSEVVGDGHDYSAGATGVISSSVGSFPTVTGVKFELDELRPNTYSLQLNSNFMTNAACNGISGCLSWAQFVYSSSEKSVFMQYWLIDYGTCPDSSWNVDGSDCWKNSAAVSAPKIAITELSELSVSGAAQQGGLDTMIFTSATEAYSTSGPDTVVDLASTWQASEFNVIGDGGGSQANFNAGSSVTVNIGISSGSVAAPSCAANSGTTGETNNLKLGSCNTTGGASPFVQFTETN